MPDLIGIEVLGALQQLEQGAFDHRLAAGRRYMEDAHVLGIGSLAVEAAQRVVRVTKGQRREQLLAPAIAGEGAGLLHKRPDHVMIIDARRALAADSRQPFNQPLGVVDLETIVMEQHPDPFAD